MIGMDQISEHCFDGTLYDVYLECILRKRKEKEINDIAENCMVQLEQCGSQSSVAKEYMNFVHNDKGVPTASQTNPEWESMPSFNFSRSSSSSPQANYFPDPTRVKNGVPFMVSDRKVDTGIRSCYGNNMFPSRVMMKPPVRMVRRGPTSPGICVDYPPPLFVQSQRQPAMMRDVHEGYIGQLHPMQQPNCVRGFGSENIQLHFSSTEESVKFSDTGNHPSSPYIVEDDVIGEPVLEKMKKNRLFPSDEIIDQPSTKRLRLDTLCNWDSLEDQNLAELLEIDTSPESGVTDNSPVYELNDASVLPQGSTNVHKQSEIPPTCITIAEEEDTDDDRMEDENLAERIEIDTSPVSDVIDYSPGFEVNNASVLPQEITDAPKQNELQQPNITIAEEDGTGDDEPMEVELSSKPVEAKEPESTTDNDEGIKLKEVKNLDLSMSASFTELQIREHLHSKSEEFSQQQSSPGSKNICLLCAKNELNLAPTPIYCTPCSGRIKYTKNYYKKDEDGTIYICCSSCYKGAHDTSIIIQGVRIPKEKFKKENFHEQHKEPWVECKKCQGWLHRVCALYNAELDPDRTGDYVCPKCCLQEIESGDRLPLPETKAFGAKNLPSTKLSDHLEQRLFTSITQERQNTAKSLGRRIEEVPEAGDLVVRVALNADKNLAVKKEYRDIFPRQNYPESFPYKSKAILLFQKIDGVDVCIFIMYVQEFGSECGDPNKRCVYISYLDSINYFRPRRQTSTGEALRTFVYHELLIGYLDYCKKRGFVSCYLWACPPSKGEDYIFNCHPESQKAPKSEKLRAWYRRMLKKALIENVVVTSSNLYEEFFVAHEECTAKMNAPCLPYFDGDFWSNSAMEIVSKENIKAGGSQKLKIKKKATPKRTFKTMGLRHNDETTSTDMVVMKKLEHTILSTKDDFIVVHLQLRCTCCREVISDCRYSCYHCKNFHICSRCAAHKKNICGKKHQLTPVAIKDVVPAETEDNNENLECPVLETRLKFLEFCQQNNYQFDTLRRAKHSSMMTVYQLSKSTAPELPPPPEVSDLRSLVNHVRSCKRRSPCKYDPKCRQLTMLFLHYNHCKDRSEQECKYCRRVLQIFKRSNYL